MGFTEWNGNGTGYSWEGKGISPVSAIHGKQYGGSSFFVKANGKNSVFP